ncbi:hypothetical protein B296_00044343 [Ensete ventricosum]|uniref:Uncharacterized protein n=1 Tax=Ensete ventricosum TaxID=4639 RepID=A0A426XXR6_ENSVE|nr:hypothetical protein B296_00044343 [Ensete ventricosum]
MAIASSPPHAYSSCYCHQPELSQPTTIAMTDGRDECEEEGRQQSEPSRSPLPRPPPLLLTLTPQGGGRGEGNWVSARGRGGSGQSPHKHLRLSTSLKGKRKRERRWKGAEATQRALANKGSKRGQRRQPGEEAECWRALLVLPKGDFILTGEEVARTFGLTSVVTSGMTESYSGLVGVVVWGEDMVHHATLMARGGGVGWRSVWTPPPRMLILSSGVMVGADAKALQALEAMKSHHDFDSTISLKSLASIQKHFSILNECVLHAPGPGQWSYHSYPEGFSISIDALEVGLRFPLHPVIGECLGWWQISSHDARQSPNYTGASRSRFLDPGFNTATLAGTAR